MIALGILATERGYKARYFEASSLVLLLKAVVADNRLEVVLKDIAMSGPRSPAPCTTPSMPDLTTPAYTTLSSMSSIARRQTGASTEVQLSERTDTCYIYYRLDFGATFGFDSESSAYPMISLRVKASWI